MIVYARFWVWLTIGQGILRDNDGAIFEGDFHNHKQHGVGSLISRCVHYWHIFLSVSISFIFSLVMETLMKEIGSMDCNMVMECRDVLMEHCMRYTQHSTQDLMCVIIIIIIIIKGQWKGGVYHGEGSLLHASGFTYQGMWFNGRPSGNINVHD